ncbi:MAG TPA: hypothetical protein VMW73_10520 [Spirochaetia bacterium]|nr:hypothetical protein [Spirochaetia bacterium]
MSKMKLLLLGSTIGVALLAGVALHLTLRPAVVELIPSAPPRRSAVRNRSFALPPSPEPELQNTGTSATELAHGLGWESGSVDVESDVQTAGEVVREVPVVDATWIRYVGEITDADGTSWHYFKDSRSGRIICGTAGPGPDQINLSATADRYILQEGTIRLGVRIPR